MSESFRSPIVLGNLSLQPCIDKLTAAVFSDAVRLAEFKASDSLQQKVSVLLKTYSHKTDVTIREAVFEIVKELSRYGETEEGKSEELAEQCKLEGSKVFSKHQDQVALQMYTKALQLCPKSSDNIPLLYANRSAVLYHMASYQDSLDDISRAERHGYPNRLCHKLLVRKAQCLQQLGLLSETERAVTEATACVAKVLDKKQQTTYLSTLGNITKAMEELNTRKTTTPADCTQQTTVQINGGDIDHCTNTAVPSINKDTSADDRIPADMWEENTEESNDYLSMSNKYDLLDGPHESINYMSSALKIRVRPGEGRHIISKHFIHSGSTVFVERPFATILLPHHHRHYCYNCITALPNTPIPCNTCRSVLFCNERCRAAGSIWHRLDCCRLTLTSAGGMAQLALRAVMVAGWPVCGIVRNETHVPDGGLYNGNTRVARYRAMYQLVHHLDTSTAHDQIQYCLAAIILTTGLQNKLCYLSGVEVQCSSELQEGWGGLEEVAALIYRHIAQLVCNGYAIYQVLAPPRQQEGADTEGDDAHPSGGVEPLSQERLASAIFPSASLMNHSCKPSTINSYVGNLLVVRTVEPLAEGSQIYSCYGPHYCRQPRSERQSLLRQQYHFTCQCKPCTQPKYVNNERRWCGFRCEECGGVASFDDSEEIMTCYECGYIAAPSESFRDGCTRTQELHSVGMSGLKGGNLDQSVRDLREAVRLGERVYCLDNQCLAAIHDGFAMVLAAAGSYEECCLVLRKYLKLVERRYGSTSVEAAHELAKLVRVARQSKAQGDQTISSDEISSLESRMSSIFTINYGKSWRSIVCVDV